MEGSTSGRVIQVVIRGNRIYDQYITVKLIEKISKNYINVKFIYSEFPSYYLATFLAHSHADAIEIEKMCKKTRFRIRPRMYMLREIKRFFDCVYIPKYFKCIFIPEDDNTFILYDLINKLKTNVRLKIYDDEICVIKDDYFHSHGEDNFINHAFDIELWKFMYELQKYQIDDFASIAHPNDEFLTLCFNGNVVCEPSSYFGNNSSCHEISSETILDIDPSKINIIREMILSTKLTNYSHKFVDLYLMSKRI